MANTDSTKITKPKEATCSTKTSTMKRSLDDFEQDNGGPSGPTRDSKRPRAGYNYIGMFTFPTLNFAETFRLTKEAVEIQTPNPAATARCNLAATVHASDTLGPLLCRTESELQTLISLEIEKQKRILCSRLKSDLSSGFNQEMTNIWFRHALAFEHKMLVRLNIDIKNIGSTGGTVHQMMMRQYEMLERAWYREFPSPKDTESLEHRRHREHAKRSILIIQLQEIRSWTAAWQQGLQVRGDKPQAPSSSQAANVLRRNPGIISDAQDKPQPLHGSRYLQPSQPAQKWNSSAHKGPKAGGRPPKLAPSAKAKESTSRRTLHHSQQTFARDSLLADHDSRHGYKAHHAAQQLFQRQSYRDGPQVGHDRRAQPSYETPRTGHRSALDAHFPQDLIETNSSPISISKPANLQANSFVSGPMPRDMQTRLLGFDSNAQVSSNIVCEKGTTQIGQSQPPRKQRGATQAQMFLRAPPRNTSLSQSALVDEDEILLRFPEHLSHAVVMQRFVQSSPTRTGGYPTSDMVNVLLQHENKLDVVGITKEQRRANLRRWIVNEKDACNKKLREGRVPSHVPARMVVALPAAELLPLPANSSTMMMPPQRSQVQPAITAPVGSQALGCPTPFLRLSPPRLSSTTAISQAALLIKAPALPNDFDYALANDQYPVDSRLPDLDVENSDSYDFDLGVERGA